MLGRVPGPALGRRLEHQQPFRQRERRAPRFFEGGASSASFGRMVSTTLPWASMRTIAGPGLGDWPESGFAAICSS